MTSPASLGAGRPCLVWPVPTAVLYLTKGKFTTQSLSCRACRARSLYGHPLSAEAELTLSDVPLVGPG